MIVLKAPAWKDYDLLDTGNGKRLERFGQYILERPDPQIIWKPRLSEKDWRQADAVFVKTESGKEYWQKKTTIPGQWKLQYKNIAFYARLSPFKHTGIFPEQAAQWDWIETKIKDRRSKNKEPINVLNLFAYTGIASLAAAAAGAHITHVDASKPSIGWFKDNVQVSGLTDKPIRWILDDALKFAQREVKRGKKYDGIIMDPPVYGHGPNGEKWDFNTHFPELLQTCQQLSSEQPLFVIVNAYAISSSSIMLANMLNQTFGTLHGNVEYGELVLQEKNNGRLLSTGIFARWDRD